MPKLDDRLLEAIKTKLGFEKVTKTQAAVCPLFMSNKDVCVKACTGSGKTLAFALPVTEYLRKNQILGCRKISAIVLAPTRELAI